jgi:hypothetical protein
MSKTQEIIAYFTENPDAVVADVAKRFKAHPVTVYQARSKMRKSPGKSASASADGNGARPRGKAKGRRRGRRSRAASAVASSPARLRRAPRSKAGDSELLDRLRAEYDSLGQLIALLENPTARDVLTRLTV